MTTTSTPPDDGLVRREHHDLIGHSEAVFSPDETYRYLLLRRWQPGPPTCVFLMLNPSTATELVNDPTVTRCEGFARREGAHALVVLNLFAYRATNPHHLARAADPVGPANDRFILQHATTGALVIAAWGTWGSRRDRAAKVTRMLTANGVELHCLGMTSSPEPQPRHPLYLPRDAPLQPLRRILPAAS